MILSYRVLKGELNKRKVFIEPNNAVYDQDRLIIKAKIEPSGKAGVYLITSLNTVKTNDRAFYIQPSTSLFDNGEISGKMLYTPSDKECTIKFLYRPLINKEIPEETELYIYIIDGTVLVKL